MASKSAASTSAAGTSWMFENRVPHILEGDYSPRSAIDIFTKILASDEDIASGCLGLGISKIELLTKRVEDFHREEGDLAFVIRFIIEKTIAPNPASCHAFNLADQYQTPVIVLTDKYLADLIFRAVQVRNNPDFTCASLE